MFFKFTTITMGSPVEKKRSPRSTLRQYLAVNPGLSAYVGVESDGARPAAGDAPCYLVAGEKTGGFTSW